MDEAEKYLKSNTGFCVFPVVDPKTGKAKHTCGAMTFKRNGVHEIFCEKHKRELAERVNQRKGKGKHFLLLGSKKK